MGGLFDSAAKKEAKKEPAGDDELGFGVDEEGGGEQTMATRPWLGTLPGAQPDSYTPGGNDPPAGSLELEYVYGFRGHDVRGVLAQNSAGKAVYPQAGVAVIYDSAAKTQTWFRNHDDDVLSLAISNDGDLVATGQIGKRPVIHIWRSSDPSTPVKTLKGHKSGVVDLCFSADGSQLASVGADDDHTHILWDVEAGSKLADCSQKPVTLFCLMGKNKNEFVSGGKNQVMFFTYTGGALDSKKGLFGKYDQTMMVCGRYAPNGDVVTGTGTGDLYIWSGRNCVKSVAAHAKGVFCLANGKDGIVSGGKDGTVKVWNEKYETTATFDFNGKSPMKGISEQIVSVAAPENRLLVGTKAGEIWEVEGYQGEPKLIMQGHYDKELWGLATHPTDADQFITAGEEGAVAIWSQSKKEIVLCTNVGEEARCVEYSPDGTMVAVGLNNGYVVILDATTLAEKAKVKSSAGKKVEEVKFSPNSQLLAAGNHASEIDVWNCDGFKQVGTCKGHSSSVFHIDWSEDSTIIQTLAQSYEILWYGSEDCKQITTPVKADLFSTWTCKLGWPVQGIWPLKAHDKTDINACDRNHAKDAIVTGDDWGGVKLFNYPAINEGGNKYKEGSAFKEERGHSAHVTKVRWLLDDSYVISTGGGEHSIFQWKYNK